MNTPPTHDDPLLDLVAKLDPLRAESDSAAMQYKQEIFARIETARNAHDEHHEVAQDESRQVPIGVTTNEVTAIRNQKRRRFALPGVIAASLAVVVSMLLFGVFGAPSAEAELIAVAERTEAIDSARLEVVVDLREPVELAATDFELHYTFDGDDYRLDVLSQGVIGFSELQVGGVDYMGDGFGPGELQWSVNEGPLFSNDFLGGFLTPDTRPDSVLPLIRLAEDYEVTRSDTGSVYTGSISRADLLAEPELPAGLAIVTTGSDPAAELPETMVITLTVIDDLIHQVDLLVEGDIATGEFFSATVITRYFAHGEPQNLIAPSVLSPAAGPVMPADDQAVVPTVDLGSEFVIPPPFWAPGPEPRNDDEATIIEVWERRPGLCFNAGLPKNPVPGQRVTDEEIREGVIDCFAVEGEPEAALAASRVVSFDN